MLRVRILMTAVVAIWLAGCAGDTTAEPGNQYARAELLEGIEIDRIGQYRVGLREFQDRALADAVAFVTGRGVARERITRIIIDTIGGDVTGNRRRGMRRRPVRFTLWMRIEGCEANVVFRAGPTGRIGTSQDKSGCLSAAVQPAQ